MKSNDQREISVPSWENFYYLMFMGRYNYDNVN